MRRDHDGAFDGIVIGDTMAGECKGHLVCRAVCVYVVVDLNVLRIVVLVHGIVMDRTVRTDHGIIRYLVLVVVVIEQILYHIHDRQFHLVEPAPEQSVHILDHVGIGIVGIHVPRDKVVLIGIVEVSRKFRHQLGIPHLAEQLPVRVVQQCLAVMVSRGKYSTRK